MIEKHCQYGDSAQAIQGGQSFSEVNNGTHYSVVVDLKQPGTHEGFADSSLCLPIFSETLLPGQGETQMHQRASAALAQHRLTSVVWRIQET